MPDYSACWNDNCVRRYNCARFMMKASSNRQTITSFEWFTCNKFIPIHEAQFKCYTLEEKLNQEKS